MHLTESSLLTQESPGLKVTLASSDGNLKFENKEHFYPTQRNETQKLLVIQVEAEIWTIKVSTVLGPLPTYMYVCTCTCIYVHVQSYYTDNPVHTKGRQCGPPWKCTQGRNHQRSKLQTHHSNSCITTTEIFTQGLGHTMQLFNQITTHNANQQFLRVH